MSSALSALRYATAERLDRPSERAKKMNLSLV